LNAREASPAVLRNNSELMKLVAILGLSFEKRYEAGPDAAMRYGKVWVMLLQPYHLN